VAKRQPDPQATTNPPDAQNGAATAVLDPPAEADTPDASWPTVDGFADWCKEDVVYLFDPDTRELKGANIRLSSDDGQTGDTYEATIRRDGSGDTWAWHEGKRFMGTHAPDLLTLVTRSLTRGRGLILAPYVT
jgi:hypothetical protein